MSRDLYADGYEVAEQLREAGLLEWSQRVASAIENGFTATEILMGLRWQLEQVLGSEVDLPSETAALARKTARAVGEVLGE